MVLAPLDASRFAPLFAVCRIFVWWKKGQLRGRRFALRSKLLKEWNDGEGTLAHYPKRSDWSYGDLEQRAKFGSGWRARRCGDPTLCLAIDQCAVHPHVDAGRGYDSSAERHQSDDRSCIAIGTW